jgi:tRNA uridine 5-carbamoylmethylation protein Kti12
MQENRIWRKNKDMVTRVIDDETILLPIYRSSDEINCIYTLNKVASEVWGLIDGKRPLKKIKEIILERFETTPKEADKKLGELVKDLVEIKAIK